MAQKGIDQALEQGHLDLEYWAEHVMQRIKLNFRYQRVWPFGWPGPYRGYANTKAAERSTGSAYKNIYTKVYAAAGGDTNRIEFFFNEYLQYVDMGVGRGQDLSELKARGKYKDAKKPLTLHARWNGMGDRQARPALMKELRHQLRRLQSILWAYYATQSQIVMLSVLDDEGEVNFKKMAVE